MANTKPLHDVAADLGLRPDDLIPFGHDKAKIRVEHDAASSRGKLVLVTAMTPTRAGEGKTSVAIGLADALAAQKRSVCLALREPSMGPCMGIKGGGTGGGQSYLHPSDDINLHFTGDFHAVTSAHNLLSASLDNLLHFGADLGLEGRRITWPRVVDVSDRALRQIVTGLGGPTMGVPNETGFEITAASELMAILCLTEDVTDFRERLDRIVLGFTRDGQAVQAKRVAVTGAMLAVMRDVLHPNLAQTGHGTPALVHGGPFANIAHGCSSVIATRTGLQLADYVVTEAGFGTDLGAEKFFHIKCRSAGLDVAAVVIVATARALKLHGGVSASDLDRPDPAAVAGGLPNLDKHIDNIARFGKTSVVAVNRFASDTDEELDVILQHCRDRGQAAAPCDAFIRGPAGADALASEVHRIASEPGVPVSYLYAPEESVTDKIAAVAKNMYGAGRVTYTHAAERSLRRLEAAGYTELPICVAKTQASLSDETSEKGRPEGFTIKVRDVRVCGGAGFIVVLTRDIVRMPGLPRQPQAGSIDLVDGKIVGLR